jgi:hypothetical protein
MKIFFTVLFIAAMFFQSNNGKGVQTSANSDNTTDYVYTNEATFDKSGCSCKGKKLYGRVKVVTAFPDFKVKEVNSFPDLKVKVKTSFADKCGEWIFVESYPDFTVQFVESFPDFTIKYVESFPGTN